MSLRPGFLRLQVAEEAVEGLLESVVVLPVGEIGDEILARFLGQVLAALVVFGPFGAVPAWRSEALKVAVGFSPRIGRETGSRRVATPETHVRCFHASLRDAIRPIRGSVG